MKKIVLGGAGVLVLAVTGIVGFVAMLPDTIALSRSIEVNAAPIDVAPYAEDLKHFVEWSPWRDIDPDLTQTWSESTTGIGAWYAWTGNDDVGEGKQTITELGEGKVVHDLHFIRPFEDHATSTITWTGNADTTTITWAFEQQAGLGTKAANLVLDIEGMLGKDYEKGLADMKPLVETAATKRRAAEEQQRLADEAVAREEATAEAEAEE